jgi:hypothetical protein
MKNFPEELMHGSGRMMILDPTRLLLAFREGIARDEVGTRIDKFGLLLEDAQDSEEDKQSRPVEAVNQTDRHFWVRSLAGRPITEEAVEALQNRLADALDWVAPVYRLGEGEGRGGLLCPLPHVLLIKPSPRTIGEKRNKLAQILQQCGLKEVAVTSAYLNDYSYHLLDNVRERNAYQLRDVLLCEQKDLISDVRFENMPIFFRTP